MSGRLPSVKVVVAMLRRRARRGYRAGMERYALPTDRALGVAVGDIRAIARQVGRDHQLAMALWRTGWYEARMLATMVDEPARVNSSQMDRWCRDFDSWGICDTACFELFDRTPHAYRKVVQWARRDEEFVRRAAFSLMASLSIHDRTTPDRPMEKWFVLIERASTDDRNFVKKGVNWALRSLGSRSVALHRKANRLSKKLARSSNSTARWIGRDALRDLQRPIIARRVASREARRKARQAKTKAL
jgi:3-methyladenine DNA glycosylase AlkD